MYHVLSWAPDGACGRVRTHEATLVGVHADHARQTQPTSPSLRSLRFPLSHSIACRRLPWSSSIVCPLVCCISACACARQPLPGWMPAPHTREGRLGLLSLALTSDSRMRTMACLHVSNLRPQPLHATAPACRVLSCVRAAPDWVHTDWVHTDWVHTDWVHTACARAGSFLAVPTGLHRPDSSSPAVVPTTYLFARGNWCGAGDQAACQAACLPAPAVGWQTFRPRARLPACLLRRWGDRPLGRAPGCLLACSGGGVTDL